ncbi:DUF397 domain-containing protein [Spirillospora sp. NPDC048819]|uniref:DUF397 domain-containing protein n=1 Tax=Spirillospora sp. NPDC048819 TaxID=3155268 RepID=UPI0033ECDA8F
MDRVHGPDASWTFQPVGGHRRRRLETSHSGRFGRVRVAVDMTDISRATWRKSSHSSANGECVEISRVHGAVAVRDSRDPQGLALLFARSAWQVFSRRIKQGAHDA